MSISEPETARLLSRGPRLSRRGLVTGLAAGAGLAGGWAHAAPRQLQAALDAVVAAQALPGATAAIAVGDGPVRAVASGFADLERGQRMPVDALMPAASIGKTFVSAWGLALQQEGRLELDAPISRWFADRPWFARLPNGPELTIRILLTHTSGLADHAWDPAYLQAFFARTKANPDDIFPPEALVEFVLDRPPLGPAGRSYHYSDTNYILAGLIFEQVSGDTYYNEIRRRFFRPLGLSEMRSSDRRSYPKLVNGYLRQENPLGLPEKSFVHGALFVNPGVEFTGGGVMSTAADLARWGRALYTGRALAGPYLDELLTAPQTPPHEEGRYGLGVAIREAPGVGRTWGHVGTMPYYGSVMAFLPDRRLTVAIMANCTDFDRAAALRRIVAAIG